MSRRTPLDSRVEMTQIVLPTHTNNHGTAFGGQVAAWCDICAAVSAQRFCRSAVVTASMDQLHFLVLWLTLARVKGLGTISKNEVCH